MIKLTIYQNFKITNGLFQKKKICKNMKCNSLKTTIRFKQNTSFEKLNRKPESKLNWIIKVKPKINRFSQLSSIS